MKTYKLKIPRLAQNDIKSIVNYIAHDLKSPDTALKKFDKINSALHSLDTMPERHALVRDNYLAMIGIRFLPVDNYMVFYRVTNNVVVIMRVLQSKQNWHYLLGGTEE